MAVVWDVTDKDNCPVTTPLGSQEMHLHYNFFSLYRIEMPSLGISIHRWCRCSERANIAFLLTYFALLMASILLPPTVVI